jgi:ComF family protein
MTPQSPVAMRHDAPWRPGPCPICGDWHARAPCPACLARFAAPRPRCQRCALPLASAADRLCGACLHHPPPWDAALAGADYAFPWDGLITRLKFGGDLSLLPALCTPLATALRAAPHTDAAPIDWVLPLPLAPQRLRERGFNQAWEIARRLARPQGLAARHDLLLRWRETAHQTGLPRDERLANLRGAFMPAPGARARLAGRHVALVDDVLTTGASAVAASRALREAGVARITLWLLARTDEGR